MATTKYGLPTVDYSQTGWNANLKSAIESIDLYMHTWYIVTLGEGVSNGDALYIQNNGKWYKSKGDNIHLPAQGLAVEDGVTDATIRLQLIGPFTLATWTWVRGKAVWLSSSSYGDLTQTKPATHAQFIGVAVAVDTINLNIHMSEGALMPVSTTTTTSSSTTTTTTV